MFKWLKWSLLVLAVPAIATHVAVLETTAGSGVITLEEKQYLTDVLRSEAVKALPAEQNYTIMTRENINMMLPPGKAIEDCEGSCLVETGKNISADYIAQGHVGRFADNLTITVELYETAGNKLMGSFSSKARNIESLETEIRQKSQELFARIVASSYGKLDLQPTLEKNIGQESDLVIKIDGESSKDGRKYMRGVWEVPPGMHTVEFTHRCYDSQPFKVNVLSGKTTVVNNPLDLKKKFLSIATEFKGEPRVVPVLVNGEPFGSTPLYDNVPVCAKIEVGEEGFREIVLTDWQGNDKLEIVYKLKAAKLTAEELRADSIRAAEQAAADEAARKAAASESRSKIKTPVSVVLMALGAVGLMMGVYENMVLGSERDKYDKASYSTKAEYDAQWDKVESAETLRNILYGAGAGLIGAGAVVLFVF
ncbi:hypothetical protein [Fibrobacter sp.]|uniref:hypothetical protein n=1 Tax=Fibrobacter sp. TaxID=35828 RepID=UPI003866D3AF